MKNTLNYLSNKAICAALVVLGAFAASAELVKTPILDAENVSVGYKVTGLENDEVAMVYTNHLRTATWTVPATLNNVQFLVVGGGGGGGVGFMGAGGGGGGVVTGYVYKLEKGVKISVKVGAGGTGGTNKNPFGVGGDSSIIVGETPYVLAYGGGAGGKSVNGGDGGSGAGGGVSSSNPVKYIGGEVKEAECAEGVLFAESFGHKGGSNGSAIASSGGGGGAMGDGGDSIAAKGGAGGVGLKMDITGALILYGSGGGGGGNAQSGAGGENAGTGGKSRVNGTSAKANCGGGGGGGGPANTAGGDGGSGIVVFRYKEPNTSGFKIIVR